MINRIVTINCAVRQSDPLWPLFQQLGFTALNRVDFAVDPGQAADTTLLTADRTSISLVEPLADHSPLNRFMAKRGEGIASVTIEVDSLLDTMASWSALGVAWWMDEPTAFDDVRFGDFWAERVIANWTDPKSLHGIAFEVLEVIGETFPRTDIRR